MEIFGLFILGCFGGFLFGMVGIGGNVLYIPIFSFFLTRLGFHDEELSRAIIANALLILVFTGTAVSWKQFKVGNFFLREILLTASTGVLAAVILTGVIKSGDWYNKKMFDVVFTLMLMITLFRLFTVKPKQNTLLNAVSTNLLTFPFLLVGLFTGSMTALSGLGGSIVMIPLFTEGVGLEMKKAHSISVGVVPIMALAISLFYCFGQPSVVPFTGQIGYLNCAMAAPVIVGSMLTSPFGVQAAHKVKPTTQRLVFASIVGIVLLKMILNLMNII
jgi:uncharacterized membrane protein YfcA